MFQAMLPMMTLASAAETPMPLGPPAPPSAAVQTSAWEPREQYAYARPSQQTMTVLREPSKRLGRWKVVDERGLVLSTRRMARNLGWTRVKNTATLLGGTFATLGVLATTVSIAGFAASGYYAFWVVNFVSAPIALVSWAGFRAVRRRHGLLMGRRTYDLSATLLAYNAAWDDLEASSRSK